MQVKSCCKIRQDRPTVKIYHLHSPSLANPPTRKYVKVIFPWQEVEYILQDICKMEDRLLSHICFNCSITWGRNNRVAYQLVVFVCQTGTSCIFTLSLEIYPLLVYLSLILDISLEGWRLSSHVTPPSISMTRATVRHILAGGWRWSSGWLIYPPQPEMKSDGSGSWNTGNDRIAKPLLSHTPALTLRPPDRKNLCPQFGLDTLRRSPPCGTPW